MGRNIRVDLASQPHGDRDRGNRGGFGGSRDPNEPDRTEGNWRSGPPPESKRMKVC